MRIVTSLRMLRVSWHGALALALFLAAMGAGGSGPGGAPANSPSEPAPAAPVKPSINGPRVVGSTPGRPFLFLIPTTGQGPFTFSAKSLPPGLTLDSKTGIITGALQKAGTTVVELRVRGPKGSDRRKLTIVGGEHRLALTPPMGWNSWNAWGPAVDAQKVRQAADWLVRSGLAAHGYQYINIDDTWEGARDASGEIQTNKKFGDLKALADEVHGKGLKLGIYSSPGPQTCAGFEGSAGHEEQDARTYARLGIDYLKYDWCSCRSRDLKEPYRVMRAALDKVDRDIVFSLCQYGMGNVWEWGTEVGGNLWRTTGDITDRWDSMAGIGFGQDSHEKYAGPGHWNDPDMLVVGKLGWGQGLHNSRLTPVEQRTHITLWCLLAAPLLIGCDLSQLDSFTLDLLTNDEVIDVDQDPLGQAAGRRLQSGSTEVWARPLWDGTLAVGLFNRGDEAAMATAPWPALGLKGFQPVRDLWQRQDVGNVDGTFTTRVPAHGAVLVKIGKPRGEG
jgi:alpha-galactosidase